MYSIFKDTPCLNGNPLINNNSFRKCDFGQLEQNVEMPSMRKSTYSLKYLKIPMDVFDEYTIENTDTIKDKPTYVSNCLPDVLFGDLYYGSESTIQVVEYDYDGYSQETAIVLTESVHPMHYDSFTKMFCGRNLIPDGLISNDYSGRPYGFSFKFSRK